MNALVSSGDQLVAVNHVPVQSHADVSKVIKGNFFQETIPITVHFVNGETRDLNVKLNCSHQKASPYLVVPTVISFIFDRQSVDFWLATQRTCWTCVFLLHPLLPLPQGLCFNLTTTHEFTAVWTFGCAVAGGAMVALGLSFPQSPRLMVSYPYLRWVGLFTGVMLALFATPTLFNF
ncbi:MAG: hypothetical protein IPN96_23645 [Anaerolineales bacterium]|nr:hypothetical protein [Anaerolineales bacterium]